MNFHRTTRCFGILFGALMLLPSFAQAHPGHGASDFGSGVVHPFFGLDHLLTMIAVGLWAFQLGGKCRWIIPAAFIGFMVIGGAFGMSGFAVPMLEHGILASMFVCGLFVAMAVRLPVSAGLTLVAAFAFLHGAAHGMELPATASGLRYVAGFSLSTLILHGFGLSSGILLRATALQSVVRFAGGSIAACAMLLWLGVF